MLITSCENSWKFYISIIGWIRKANQHKELSCGSQLVQEHSSVDCPRGTSAQAMKEGQQKWEHNLGSVGCDELCQTWSKAPIWDQQDKIESISNTSSSPELRARQVSLRTTSRGAPWWWPHISLQFSVGQISSLHSELDIYHIKHISIYPHISARDGCFMNPLDLWGTVSTHILGFSVLLDWQSLLDSHDILWQIAKPDDNKFHQQLNLATLFKHFFGLRQQRVCPSFFRWAPSNMHLERSSRCSHRLATGAKTGLPSPRADTYKSKYTPLTIPTAALCGFQLCTDPGRPLQWGISGWNVAPLFPHKSPLVVLRPRFQSSLTVGTTYRFGEQKAVACSQRSTSELETNITPTWSAHPGPKLRWLN